MSRGVLRTAWLLVVLTAFGAALLRALGGLPGLGHYPGPHGDVVNALTVPERHSASAVAVDSLINYLPYAVAAWLFLVGMYGIATSRNLIQLTICMGVVQSSTYVLLLATGYRCGATAPIFSDVPPGTPAFDPVTHALVLTDIVVGASVTALLLAICIQIQRHTGSLDARVQRPLQNT